MKPVLVRLKEYGRTCSNTERQIIRYILEEPDKAVNLSVQELAKNTYASVGTVVRLSKRIGFSGIKELKMELISELALLEKNQFINEDEITKEDTSSDILNKVMRKHTLCLEETKALMDIYILEECVKLMKECRNIILLGIGASFLVAKDFEQKFMRLNKLCVIHEDYHSQIVQCRNASKNDLVIVFSYSGKTKEVVKNVNICRDSGAKIIAITGFGASPISELADYNLYVSANEPTKRSGAITSRISQLLIVDILYNLYIKKTYEKAVKEIINTQILKEL
ncbi:MurR/RpiR family transcriptional regulator [Clostridium sp. B9]|uniref:MurR/RpiR family transcriptional regulator n=1 Tax=Clostridium sp. B9 TaxID=3423224 RepID=UPI003D2EED64